MLCGDDKMKNKLEIDELEEFVKECKKRHIKELRYNEGIVDRFTSVDNKMTITGFDEKVCLVVEYIDVCHTWETGEMKKRIFDSLKKKFVLKQGQFC